MNSYIRFKLALTEDEPTIKPYMENLWAELPEAKRAPIDVSLALVDSLHQRWMLMLREFTDAEWKRTFRHPALGPMSLEKTLAFYAWHGRHHVAHVTSLREKMGWKGQGSPLARSIQSPWLSADCRGLIANF